mmetsp:Transcript_49710/g.160057  ORF Transcript_49710/g.160057 Transcript_49710/m.160057 type:complete len:304 (+) Transcript_49710:125-1036(+)
MYRRRRGSWRRRRPRALCARLLQADRLAARAGRPPPAKLARRRDRVRRAASVRSIEWGRPLRLGRGPTDSRRCASGGGAGAARSHGGGAAGGVERARTGDCQGGLGDCVEPGQDGRALLLLLGGQGRRPGAAASAAATAHVCGAGGRGRARGDHLFLLLRGHRCARQAPHPARRRRIAARRRDPMRRAAPLIRPARDDGGPAAAAARAAAARGGGASSLRAQDEGGQVAPRARQGRGEAVVRAAKEQGRRRHRVPQTRPRLGRDSHHHRLTRPHSREPRLPARAQGETVTGSVGRAWGVSVQE